jgi:hypothetical protein
MTESDQPPLFEGASNTKRRGRPPGSKNRATAARDKPGRVERALMAELRDSALPNAAKLHLRATAHLLDVADQAADVDAGAKITARYLEIRQAYGLAGSKAEALDPFAAFVAGMGIAERTGDD